MIPWKLIIILLIAVILAFFIGFNLENSCSVSFGFTTIGPVPVYLTILISFALGLVAALPFAFHRRNKKEKQLKDKLASQESAKAQGKKAENAQAVPVEQGSPLPEGSQASQAQNAEPTSHDDGAGAQKGKKPRRKSKGS